MLLFRPLGLESTIGVNVLLAIFSGSHIVLLLGQVAYICWLDKSLNVWEAI